jgi:hypothetical protein
MMGSPISSTNLTISSAFSMGPSDPGTTGTPAAIAACRAVVLSENRSRLATVGPTKAMPASSQAAAKLLFSLKKPYLYKNEKWSWNK